MLNPIVRLNARWVCSACFLAVVRSGPIFREALAPSFKSSFLVMKTGSLSKYGKLTSFTVAQVPFYGT